MVKKVKKGDYLEMILRSNKTVFTIKDIALLWRENRDSFHIKSRLSKYVSAGKLVRLRRGIYAKDKNYSPLELAVKIYTPSYISFETVLTRSGVNFQYYKEIFVASYLSRELKIDGHKIKLIKLQNKILTDNYGVDNKDGLMIASPERAFLDRIYKSFDYHFDNLNSLDWQEVYKILPIYRNKRMEKIVDKYFKHYQENL